MQVPENFNSCPCSRVPTHWSLVCNSHKTLKNRFMCYCIFQCYKGWEFPTKYTKATITFLQMAVNHLYLVILYPIWWESQSDKLTSNLTLILLQGPSWVYLLVILLGGVAEFVSEEALSWCLHWAELSQRKLELLEWAEQIHLKGKVPFFGK